jgi:hypothetical protein
MGGRASPAMKCSPELVRLQGRHAVQVQEPLCFLRMRGSMHTRILLLLTLLLLPLPAAGQSAPPASLVGLRLAGVPATFKSFAELEQRIRHSNAEATKAFLLGSALMAGGMAVFVHYKDRYDIESEKNENGEDNEMDLYMAVTAGGVALSGLGASIFVDIFGHGSRASELSEEQRRMVAQAQPRAGPLGAPQFGLVCGYLSGAGTRCAVSRSGAPRPAA